MRAFCLLLILANVLYFVWSQMIDVQFNVLDRPRVARTAEPPPRIVLAREAQQAEAAANDVSESSQSETRAVALDEPAAESTEPTAPADSAPSAAETSFTCTSVGPFSDLAEATQAQAALRGANLEPRQRMEQGELWVGYWVSVQQLESRAAAEAAKKTLQSNGITVYLMPGTEPPFTLSLGVFSDHQRAQRRNAQAKALGLSPRIEDRMRSGSVYWLDIDLPEPGYKIDTSVIQSDPGKIMRLEMRECPRANREIR
jgi:cell division protein FtsN